MKTLILAALLLSGCHVTKVPEPSPVEPVLVQDELPTSHYGTQVEETWTRCDYQGRMVSCEEYRKLVAAEQFLEGDPN